MPEGNVFFSTSRFHTEDTCEEELLAEPAALGMSLRKVTSLGSNLASVTDLKRIESPHSLCCDLEAIKPLHLVGQVAQFNFESKF